MSPRDVIARVFRAADGGGYADHMGYADQLLSALDAAGYEVNAKGMREALVPFAEYAEHIALKHPGWDYDGFAITTRPWPMLPLMGAFRAARRALKEPGT